MRHAWLALLALLSVGCGEVGAKWTLLRARASVTQGSVDKLRAFQQVARELSPSLVSLRSVPRQLIGDPPVDLGFGVRVFHLRTATIACDAEVAVFGDDAVVEHDVRCESTGEARLDEAIRPHLPNGAFTWRHRNDAVFEQAVLGRAGALGAQIPVVVPESLRTSYDRLTALSAEGVFGDHCGAGGEKPEQRTAMEALVAAGRWDLVRSVLRGPNATGRAYAANALWVHGPLDPADLTSIETLAAQPIVLRSCGGCSMGGSESWKVFRETYLTLPSHRP